MRKLYVILCVILKRVMVKLYVAPLARPILAETTVPSDKSIAHRAFLLSALAEGESMIHASMLGLDVMSMIDTLRALGVSICRDGDVRWRVKGQGLRGLKVSSSPLDCGNAGTAMRLLSGVLVGQSFNSELVGDASLQCRPMRRIVDPLCLMGANISANPDGVPPLVISPVSTLYAIDYVLPVASAQVISCLLLAGLYVNGNTVLEISQQARNHTEIMLSHLGCDIHCNSSCIIMKPVPSLCSSELHIPGDISSAAFFIVAALLVPGSDLLIRGVGVNPTRIGFLTFLQSMGAKIEIGQRHKLNGEWVADIRVQASVLINKEIDSACVTACIDELPILMIAGACAQGMMRIRGARELRYKECDRLQAMAEGLNQVGVVVQLYEDGIDICGGGICGGEVNACADHRIAMAFVVAGLMADKEISINNAQGIDTSFPGFLAKCEAMELNVRPIEEVVI